MHHLPTCSLTEARMAEVVSVSEPSPLDVFNTGLRELVLSEDEGWSGTGIVSAVHGKIKQWICYHKPDKYQTHINTKIITFI